jgi:hypothetical protein
MQFFAAMNYARSFAAKYICVDKLFASFKERELKESVAIFFTLWIYLNFSHAAAWLIKLEEMKRS